MLSKNLYTVLSWTPNQSVFKYASQAGTRDQGLLYINNRLKNTKTIVEYNNILMGFIKDRL